MPQVGANRCARNAARLRALGDVQLEKFMKARVGEKCQVIVEQSGVGFRTEHFAEVHLDFPAEQGELPRNIASFSVSEDGKLYGGRV